MHAQQSQVEAPVGGSWSNHFPASVKAAVIVVLTFLVYLPSMRGQWIWGDNERVHANPLMKDGDGLRKIWFSSEPKDYWPLFYTAFWVEWRLWGQNTLGYHVVNVLWHSLVAVLLWRVLIRLRVRGAWLAGLIFAVHPVHVDSVAWISEFVNPFSASFCLLALLCYLRCDEQDSWAWYGAGVVMFVLAMLAKTSVAMLPVVIVLCRLWLGRSWRWEEGVRLGGLCIVSVALSLVTIWFQKYSAAAIGKDWSAGFWERTAVAGHIVWFYLFNAILPYRVMFVYPKWSIDPRLIVSYLPSLGVVAVALVCLWRWNTWGRAAFVGLGVFFACLFPVLGYFNMVYMKYTYVADHWQYLADMGLIAWIVGSAAWAVDWAAGRLPGLLQRPISVGSNSPSRAVLGPVNRHRETPVQRVDRAEDGPARQGDSVASPAGRLRFPPSTAGARYFAAVWPRRCAQVVAALLIAVFGLTTWRHAGNYTDPERIWRSTLAVSNDVAMPHVNLGSLLANRAQTLEAKARREHDPAVRAEAGRLYKEAEDHYRQALRIKADDEDAHANLGVLLFRRGDITGALEHYYQALRIDPNYVGAHTRLANALLKLGRIDDALSHYRAAAGLQPNLAAAQRDLANALAVRGQWAQAVPYYRRALELAPEDVVSMHRLAWVLATASDAPVRNGPEAVALADRAVRLTRRRDPLALDALAAAYAETAQFQQAAGAAAEALDIARAQGSEALALQLARRLDGYRDGRPFRARPVPAEAGALVPPGAQR